MHTWTFYCHTMKLSGTCFLIMYLVYYYQNSCVISFRNVLEYMYLVNVYKGSVAKSLLLLMSGVTDCLESYTEREAIVEDCSCRGDLETTVRLCQWWVKSWAVVVCSRLKEAVWFFCAMLARALAFCLSRKVLCLGFSRSLKVTKRRWARFGLSFLL